MGGGGFNSGFYILVYILFLVQQIFEKSRSIIYTSQVSDHLHLDELVAFPVFLNTAKKELSVYINLCSYVDRSTILIQTLKTRQHLAQYQTFNASIN